MKVSLVHVLNLTSDCIRSVNFFFFFFKAKGVDAVSRLNKCDRSWKTSQSVEI